MDEAAFRCIYFPADCSDLFRENRDRPKERDRREHEPMLLYVQVFLNAFGHSALSDIGKINRSTYRAPCFIFCLCLFLWAIHEKRIPRENVSELKDSAAIYGSLPFFFFMRAAMLQETHLSFVLDVKYKLRAISVAPGWLRSTRPRGSHIP